MAERGSVLESLLAADPALHQSDQAGWRAFVEQVAETLDIGPGTSVFDVGCGSGAFLFPLWENGFLVGGVDPSEALIAHARAAMPGRPFAAAPPRELNPADGWQVVVGSHGLAGVTGADEVRAVLARMVAKAAHAVAVLNLTDDEAQGPVTMTRAGLLRMLAEIGVRAVQIEAAPEGRFHVFARV